MSLPNATTVLIVGAGPAGLGAALSLHHNGVRDLIIVDALSKRQNNSRAVIVHAATLEALDTIGCGDDIASSGTKSTVYIGTRSAELIRPSFDSLDPYTRHPYVVSTPQNVVECVLGEKLDRLGITVRRGLKVVGLRRNALNSLLNDVTFEDGSILTAKYVIGADGARSTVRTLAGIGFSDPAPFEGEAENNIAQMALADITFSGADIEDLSPRFTLSPHSFLAFLPLPYTFNQSVAAEGKVTISERVVRIGCGVPLHEGEVPQTPSKEYLQSLVDRFGPHHLSSDPTVNTNPTPVYIKDIIWSSRFRYRACIADTTFTRLGHQQGDESGEGGVILLVGDAAHIHSPVGGQGMNLGLRDAIFLGEALTKHIHATETGSLSKADEILREFTTVRHAHALEVIKLTKRFLWIAGMKYRERACWWCPIDTETIRTCVLWVLGSIPFIRRKLAWELSGLGRR